jgi:hypothetical protein
LVWTLEPITDTEWDGLTRHCRMLRGAVHHPHVTMQGTLRTGYSHARATDQDDDRQDLSWMDRLATDDWAAAAQLERLLADEDPSCARARRMKHCLRKQRKSAQYC